MEFLHNEAGHSSDSEPEEIYHATKLDEDFIDDEPTEDANYPNPYLQVQSPSPVPSPSPSPICTCPGEFFDPDCPKGCINEMLKQPIHRVEKRKVEEGGVRRHFITTEKDMIEAEILRSRNEYIPVRTSPRKSNYYCETCDVKCFSYDFYERHLASRRHKENTGQTKKSPEKTKGFKKNLFTQSADKKKGDVYTFCDACQKEITASHFARHCKTKKHKNNESKTMTTTQEEDPKDEEEETGEKKERGGQLFMVQFQRANKYKVARKVIAAYRFGNKWIDGYAHANEWGALADFPNGHSHMIVRTEMKLTFEEFKIAFLELTGEVCNDVQRVRNLRTALRYLTKEDYKAFVINFDMDLTSSLYRCYHYARVAKRIDWTRYPCCNISPSDRKTFEAQFYEFNDQNKRDAVTERMQKAILRPWQEIVVEKIKNQDNRQILWITDFLGNNGKTFLAEYLETLGAFVILGGAKRDIAYAYDEQEIVVIDVPREDQEKMDYSLLECLKNGWLWCPKYHSRLKRFKPAKILVLANWYPKVDRLSGDRWNIYQLIIDTLQPVDVLNLI